MRKTEDLLIANPDQDVPDNRPSEAIVRFPLSSGKSGSEPEPVVEFELIHIKILRIIHGDVVPALLRERSGLIWIFGIYFPFTTSYKNC